MIESVNSDDDVENIEADDAKSPSVSNIFNVPMLQPKRVGTERPFMPDLPPEGSVLAASFRRKNIIGNYLNTIEFDDFGEQAADYDYQAYIPGDLFENYGHLYAGTINPENAEALTSQLRSELRDAQIMENAPWRSFASTFAVNLVDPTILLPGGTLYKTTKAARGVAQSALSVGVASATGEALQQAVQHQTQQTKELDESFYEILGAGVVGAALGGIGGAFVNGSISGTAKKQVIESLADEGPIGPKMTVEQSLSAMQTRDPEYQKELNSLYGGTPVASIGKFLGYVTKELTPQGRLLFSPFGTSRAIANELPEHNLIINANLPGKRKVMGPEGKEVEVPREALAKPIAVESEIKELKRGMYKNLIDYQKIFYEQAGIKGSLKGVKQRVFKSQGLSLVDFEKAVWRTVVSGEGHDNPAVQSAADLVVNKFFNPIKDEYIRLGIFPEDIKVKTAANYFMRVYNRDKIRDPAQRTKTKAKFEAFIKRNNEELIELQPKIEALEKQIAELKRSKKMTDAEIKKGVDLLQKELKSSVPHYLWTSKDDVRKIIDPDYYGIEADKIIDNILGMGDERNLNPILSVLPNKKSSPLHERSFLIDDIEIEDELITSFVDVAPMFINATAPNIALMRYAERLGLETGGEARGLKITQLEEDYRLAVEKAPDKEPKLYKQFQKDKKDIEALFDILNGVYGMGPNTLDDSASRFIKNLSTWNYMRLMGQITLQAFTDVGAIGLKHGLFRTIKTGFVPVLKELKNGGYDKDFLQDLGFVTNTLQGYRLKSMIDQDPLSGQTGLFSRSLDFLSATYGNATLMNQWTDSMEFIAGKMSMARTLRAMDEWAKTGKLKEKEATRLNELGISHRSYAKIYEQMKKHGGKTDGSYWVNWTKWDGDNESMAALREFRQSTIKEIDQTVVSGPGIGEKPLYARRGLGSLIFQFKGFSYAMTNKVLISGLQRNDAEFYQGVVMLGALGLLSYGATSLARGEEMDLSADNLFKEMIDRSGITGVFGNIYNLSNKLGLIPGKEVSRYKNRGIWSTLGGPSAGIVEDNLALLQKAMHLDEKTFTSKDMDKFFRNWPTQNYLFTHRLNKMVSKQFSDALGFEESPE
jgi:hypothetical protein